METNEYRERVQQAADKLIDIREQLFEAVFQVVITGELKEWSDNMDVGEQVTFTKELFAGCEDANVQLLTQLLTNVEQTYQSLANMNNLSSDDD